MKRLVVVEDEKMIRQGICAMIKRSGVPIEEIIECKNGLEALEIVKSKKVDVMITDIRMPKMDGITLVNEISKLDISPRVIVISGYDDFSYAVELLRSGAREYLLKPVEREKLIASLKTMEEEIASEAIEIEQEQKKLEFLFNKHLRLFLTSPTSEYLEMLKVDGGYCFDEKSYWIYCVNHSSERTISVQNAIYMQDIEGQDFFIALDNQKETLDFIKESPYYGVSEKHQGILELKTAYLEAINSRKQAFYMIKDHIIEMESVAEQHRKEEDTINHITQLIGTDRLNEAIKMLELLECRVQRGEVSPVVFEELIKDLLEQIKENYKNVISIEDSAYMPLVSIYAYSNIEEYIKALSNCLVQIHGKIVDEFEDYRNKQKIQEAIEYIRANYNKDLNMAVVSNYISMNYSLFSFAFKKYTGMNFVSYVKELRVNEAKRLLANTDKKINEISLLVGYENEKNFMKVFKALYGVSPSEYRKNVQVGKTMKKTQ